MAFFYYIRPDELWHATGAVGATEDGYPEIWLGDRSPGRPVRSPDGNAAWTLTNTGPSPVNLVAVVNHDISPGVGMVVADNTGAIDTLFSVPSPRGIYNNPWRKISTRTPSSISLTVTGNPLPVIVGELVAGFARELPRPVEPGGARNFPVSNPSRGGIWQGQARYSYGVKKRSLSVSTTCTQAGLQELEFWWDSCDDSALYTLIVPTPSLDDCMFAEFESFSYTKRGPQWFEVKMSFTDAVVRWL